MLQSSVGWGRGRDACNTEGSEWCLMTGVPSAEPEFNGERVRKASEWKSRR